MYICGLIPRKFVEIAVAVTIKWMLPLHLHDIQKPDDDDEDDDDYQLPSLHMYWIFH